MFNINDIKNGMTFLFEGNIYQVIEFLHVKPGKGAAFLKTKLRNLRTGATVEKTFNTSIKLETPCEFINITPVNPLISKCQIKVCYVGDTPNRNGSIITKEVARQMANSLPGSPIVGYYNDVIGDFEEHNRVIDISNGQFKIKDTTKPYGFVDLGARAWFQKFNDDGVEHEYLMTEGYIWTGQYPECQRIIDQGNNQSMELDEKTLNATWTKDDNGKPKFFIINEAIISKLCILGEECEPCFEGSQITKFSLTFDEDFKQKLFSMMNDLKELIKEGGTKVFSRYAVEIGDNLWNSLWNYTLKKYPDADNTYSSVYAIEGVYEEDSQKFAVLQNRADNKYYRLNFSLNETDGFVPADALIEVTESYIPAAEPQFSLEAVKTYETEYASKKKAEEEDKNNKDNKSNSDNKSEGKDNNSDNPEDGKDKKPIGKKDDLDGKGNNSDDDGNKDDEDKEKKKKYSLEDVTEYQELKTEYEELKSKYAALETEKNSLIEEIEPLRKFKLASEKKDKEAMIAQFYMLSDDDKKDVIDNIDKYSVDDIEAKLSVICVRNKVSFDLDENKETKPTTYNLNNGEDDDESIPAWVKAALKYENAR